MEWIDQDVARLEKDDELVEEYLEKAKDSIQGKENAASLASIKKGLEEDLGPGDDVGYRAVKYAVERLSNESDVEFYQDICERPITSGSEQFYIE